MSDIRSVSRKVAAEGCVLLKNDGNLLPLSQGTKVALFGRMQTTYYKSGTGSGGLVHLEKEPRILESLRSDSDLFLDEKLVSVYEQWVKENPFDDGGGVWAGEPWFQKEMPLNESLVKETAKRNDVAVIILGRTAGEDHDNGADKGSYRITDDEEKMISLVTAHFSKVIIALNVGNIIDLSFLRQYPVTSLVYIWQGGMEGANAFADILTGKAAPSGKLCDTQAFSIEDYPSTENFGSDDVNVYKEDIYVGYRYFETFKKDAVVFPFGFGLTYTTFEIESIAKEENGKIVVLAKVKNAGAREGREVVQVYFKAPCGVLGTPERQLVAYKKTRPLQPGETEEVVLSFDMGNMASYDDSGVTGNKSCYVLQAGNYEIYVGTDVRSAECIYSYNLDKTVVVKRLEEVLAPVLPFERLCAVETNGERSKVYRDVPLASVDVEERIKERRPKEIPFVGNRGIKLKDLKNGKNTMDEFIAQLTDEELATMVCGEGMSSPKATPGTVGALGGQTQELLKYGLPVCAVTDGPSGIRLDTGDKASLVPNGASVASTWDDELIEQLYSYIGKELREYNIDSLLGPGMNIHRSPLCGRNFEYFSEDPLLTGKIAAAMTRGIAAYSSSATIKHFCCNNQEKSRHLYDSVVSERALREIYLKGFEIAVKEGKNVLVMTAYNKLNGYYTASNYDLNTTVLRGEWGFEGFVMTDWWARCNSHRGEKGSGNDIKGMVRAQNDIYMVCDDAILKSAAVLEGLNSGYITRGELQRNVKNLLHFILDSNTFDTFIKNGEKNLYYSPVDEEALSEIAEFKDVEVGKKYEISFNNDGPCLFVFEFIASGEHLSQNLVSLTVGETTLGFAVRRSDVKANIIKRDITIKKGTYTLSFDAPEVVQLKKLTVYN